MRQLKRLLPGFFLLLLVGTVGLRGQSLPEGKFHTIRERQIDILHFKADVAVLPAQKFLAGEVTIRLRPLVAISGISLDAIRLSCRKAVLVEAEGSRKLPYKQENQKLLLTLPREYSPAETLTVRLSYSANPNAGIYFLSDPRQPDRYFVYTYGEGGLLANVFPIYNDVNDKFSSEMIVTVPANYSVISNGRLIATLLDGKGNVTYHWRQDLPHSNYLISIYIGEFERGELPAAFGSIPLHFWVPKGRVEEGAFAFRNTTKMVEFFSQKFGYPYPWDKYDQVAVPDYAIGAMEHTGVTGHRASVLRTKEAPIDFGPPEFDRYFTVWSYENTISHELAHHWFGDNLTCASLTELWLNESFATFCHMLYDEYAHGRDTYDLLRLEALDRYLNFVATQHTIRPMKYQYFDAVNEMYTIELTYLKGALILHMMRTVLGDEAFFRTLQHYLKKHEFSNVTSEDLLTAIREVTGKNLTWFFDDWIFGGGYPVIEVHSTYLGNQKVLRLQMEQIQPLVKGQDLFILPVTVSIDNGKEATRKVVWLKERKHTFFFPCAQEPRLVSLDGGGDLVAEIRWQKSLPDLVYQIRHDQYRGRIWALRQLAGQFGKRKQTAALFRELLNGSEFWGLRAETARLLGNLDAREYERLFPIALKAGDYRIRKAAVLALKECRDDFAEKTLSDVIAKDPHQDVVATALTALGSIDAARAVAEAKRLLGRASWYDEMQLACLRVFEMAGDSTLLAQIRPFIAPTHHEFLQIAALNAWTSCSPHDPELSRTLLDLAAAGKYTVRLRAIELIGELCMVQGRKVLEAIVAEDGDLDFRVAAGRALKKIQQFEQHLKSVRN